MSRPRVLFAEDSAFLRQLVQEKLERAGFAVVSAADGDEAWQLFAADPSGFDVLLTDIQMPRCGGIELTERIRASSRPGLPVIALSSLGSFEVIRRCVATGVDAFQVKFDFDRLQSEIRQLVGRAE